MTLSSGTLLRDLVDIDLLDDMVVPGFIGAHWHPKQRLRIFNYGQPGAPALDPTAPARPNREGFVVHAPARELAERPSAQASDARVKIKYDEYVQLHRVVTGLSTRTVWEHLAAHRHHAASAEGIASAVEVDELLEVLPEEFHDWVRSVAASLQGEVSRLADDVERAYQSIVDDLPEGFSRKDFALRAATHPERACLFLQLDGKSYVDVLWPRVRPEVAPSMRSGGDDGD